jgi:hypothetical protein
LYPSPAIPKDSLLFSFPFLIKQSGFYGHIFNMSWSFKQFLFKEGGGYSELRGKDHEGFHIMIPEKFMKRIEKILKKGERAMRKWELICLWAIIFLFVAAIPSAMAGDATACWKQTKTIGVGRVPNCAPDQDKDAGLCYKKCPAGRLP